MNDKLHYRTISIRKKDGVPATFNKEDRSVEVVLATEKPVRIWGIDEILLMDGAKIPQNKRVPLLDSHNRWSVKGIVGSIKNLHRANGELVGTAVFSKIRDADDAMTLVEEGHLTDISVGYRVGKYEDVSDRETKKIKGKEYKGPVRVVTKWYPKEGSVAPIGADENSKIRSTGGGIEMENETVEERTETSEQVATREERERIGEIQAMYRRFGFERDGERMVREGKTFEEARRVLVELLAVQRESEPTPRSVMYPDYSGRVEFGGTLEDKRRNAQIGGLLLRAGGVQESDLPPGSREYATSSLIDLAKECCRAAGIRVGSLGPEKIYQRALTTSDFPYILASSQEKILQMGYEEAAGTWATWARSRAVQNFKVQKRPQLSEASDLVEVPEHGDYKYGDRTEFQEQYSVATYGRLLALTRQTIVNDDLASFADVARGHGRAAARLVNSTVYAVLIANSAMSDGVALFHANHSNLGTGGAPSETTLTEMLKMMRVQTGPQGSVLGIRPKYIIGPAALEVPILKTIKSVSLDSNNPAIINIFAEIGLIPVIEATLDADSATAWYGVGEGCDTVEVGYVGSLLPHLEQRTGWSVDGQEYKVRVDIGAKALDWRALFKNAGV